MNVRERNRSSGSIGFATRRSTTTNSTSDSDADDERAEHERMIGPERRPLEQAEDDAAQAEHGQRGAGPVDPVGSRRVAALVHEAQRQYEHDAAASGTFRKNTARQLTCSISQPPTHRADRRRDRAESRPRADRAAALAPRRTSR